MNAPEATIMNLFDLSDDILFLIGSEYLDLVAAVALPLVNRRLYYFLYWSRLYWLRVLQGANLSHPIALAAYSDSNTSHIQHLGLEDLKRAAMKSARVERNISGLHLHTSGHLQYDDLDSISSSIPVKVAQSYDLSDGVAVDIVALIPGTHLAVLCSPTGPTVGTLYCFDVKTGRKVGNPCHTGLMRFSTPWFGPGECWIGGMIYTTGHFISAIMKITYSQELSNQAVLSNPVMSSNPGDVQITLKEYPITVDGHEFSRVALDDQILVLCHGFTSTFVEAINIEDGTRTTIEIDVNPQRIELTLYKKNLFMTVYKQRELYRIYKLPTRMLPYVGSACQRRCTIPSSQDYIYQTYTSLPYRPLNILTNSISSITCDTLHLESFHDRKTTWIKFSKTPYDVPSHLSADPTDPGEYYVFRGNSHTGSSNTPNEAENTSMLIQENCYGRSFLFAIVPKRMRGIPPSFNGNMSGPRANPQSIAASFQLIRFDRLRESISVHCFIVEGYPKNIPANVQTDLGYDESLGYMIITVAGVVNVVWFA